jgi:hypothetical protein
MDELDDIPQEEIKTTRLAWHWRFARTLLLTAAATTALVLGYMVFWPWDKPPPQDADLRQLQLPPPCDPQDNAWPRLEAAQQRITNEIEIAIPPAKRQPGDKGTKKVTWCQSYDDGFLYSPSLIARDWKADVADTALNANAAIFPLIDQALLRQSFSSLPAAAENGDAAGNPFGGGGQLEPAPVNLSTLNYLLKLKAIKEQVAGNHAGATKAILQRLRITQMVFDNLGKSNYNNMTDAMQSLDELLRQPALPAPVLEQLADGMKPWNQKSATAQIKNGLCREYQRSAATLLNPQDNKCWIIGLGSSQAPVPAWSFKPRMTCRRLADETRLAISKASQPYVKFMTDMPPELSPILLRKQTLLWAFRRNGLGSLSIDWRKRNVFAFQKELPCAQEFRYSALRLVIACKRHELKYGKLPEDLQALVPEFLPAVPRDPFDGQPFRYSPVKRLVYSVGINGLDDGGSGTDSWSLWAARKNLDLIMFIDRPALPPVIVPPLESYVDQLPVPAPGGPGVGTGPFR